MLPVVAQVFDFFSLLGGDDENSPSVSDEGFQEAHETHLSGF